jgi:hypothetical protein
VKVGDLVARVSDARTRAMCGKGIIVSTRVSYGTRYRHVQWLTSNNLPTHFQLAWYAVDDIEVISESR